MTFEEAFTLIENLDYPEGLKRKFAPQFSLVQVARDGSVAYVERYKNRTGNVEQIELLNRFPGTIQFSAYPGRFPSSEALAEHVTKGVILFSQNEA